MPEYIGSKQLLNVPKDVVSVQLHPGVTEVSSAAFHRCDKLQEVVLNKGLVKICRNAFEHCTALEIIVIPSTVNEIHDAAFRGCINLKGVVLNKGLQKIGREAFKQCRVLESISIPSTVTEIGKYSFCECIRLREVVLNEGLERINNGLFHNCESLESIKFPSTMREVGDQAFLNCSRLASVSFNEGLEKIGMLSFQACSMESITFPSTLKEVGGYAFKSCTHLRQVILNESLQTIGQHAFERCSSLQGFKFTSISIRLENIIEAGQTELENKLNDFIGNAYGLVWSRGEEIFIPDATLRVQVPSTGYTVAYKAWWGDIKQSMDTIVKQVSYYEIKEATTLFELALWKEKIDFISWIEQADDTVINRDMYRIEVPGPVKDIILQYIGYNI